MNPYKDSPMGIFDDYEFCDSINPLTPTECNPRIAAFTDDLNHSELQSLLTYLYFVLPHDAHLMASVKQWRKNTGLPVDIAD